MVMGEVVEGLNSGVGTGVIPDAHLLSGNEIFDCMECSFVVLVSRVIGVRGTKGEDWGNIWSCACCQPIYAPDHALGLLGSRGWMASMGSPDQYGVMLGTGFILSTAN
jgi:hypothetical protein